MTGRHRRAAAASGPVPVRAARGSGQAWRVGRRWIIIALTAAVMSAVVSLPGIANALFAGVAASREADGTAASILAPTTFTVTGTTTSTATLVWSGPALKTGYTLSQSPGTLAGCPAMPARDSTGCTATGLTQGITYAWTLRAAYNNWLSPGFNASATTVGFAYDLGNGGSCGSSLTCTGPTVTTNSGRGELIFIYVSGTSASSVSSISGPWSDASRYALQQFPDSGDSDNYLYVYRATGSGDGPAATSVTFSVRAAGATMWMDVVELGAGESARRSCDGCTARGANGPALATINVDRDTDEEIAFLGSGNGGGFVTAPGFSVLGGGTGSYGTYANPVIASSSTFPMSPDGNWGSVSLEITSDRGD